MRIFECDYVVRMWGVAAASEPLMIVMELVSLQTCCRNEDERRFLFDHTQASNGALNSYLEKNQLDDNQKAVMCLQVCGVKATFP